MNGRKISIVALASLAMFTLAHAESLFSAGFESPTYALGDISGQDGWMITPSGAAGTIQTAFVQSGSQAVEMIDAASFGRGQRSISGVPLPILNASFGMMFDDAWGAQMEADRFEAQMRVEVSGPGGTFGIEFGFLKAPTGGYETVPADGSAFFIEIGSESAILGKAYDVVTYADYANTWHTYDLVYDSVGDLASLYVDGTLRTQVTIADDLLSLSNIQLQNQRWGTSPQNSASLYYDNVSLSVVPEPATVGALLVGIAALLRSRKRQ